MKGQSFRNPSFSCIWRTELVTVLKMTRVGLMSNVKEKKIDENKHISVMLQKDFQLTIRVSIHLSCKHSFRNPGQLSLACSLL